MVTAHKKLIIFQLIRSLKRKLHEQEEVLSGKDKVVGLLQYELTERNTQISVSFFTSFEFFVAPYVKVDSNYYGTYQQL